MKDQEWAKGRCTICGGFEPSGYHQFEGHLSTCAFFEPASFAASVGSGTEFKGAAGKPQTGSASLSATSNPSDAANVAAIGAQPTADSSATILEVGAVGASRSTPAPPFDFVERLQMAQGQVKSSSLYRRFIDGTPLENDIAVWMTTFAAQAVRDCVQLAGSEGDVPAPTPADEAEQGRCHHCGKVGDVRFIDARPYCADGVCTRGTLKLAVDILRRPAASPPGAADARKPQAKVEPCEKLNTGATMGYMHRWSAGRCQCGALPPFADSVISNVPVAPAAPRAEKET